MLFDYPLLLLIIIINCGGACVIISGLNGGTLFTKINKATAFVILDNMHSILSILFKRHRKKICTNN